MADEGEATALAENDQKGSISIIRIGNGTPEASVTNLTFDDCNQSSIAGNNLNPDTVNLQTDALLGRLKVVPYLGKNANGEYQQSLYICSTNDYPICDSIQEYVI